MAKYWVLERKMWMLRNKMDKLVRRSQKLGVGNVSWSKTGEKKVEEQSYVNDFGERCKLLIPYVEVEVTGEAPALAGWRFIGSIQHMGDVNFVRTIDERFPVPKEYFNADPICQHCNRKRRRNDTFVLLKDGQYIQVGRNCLADFLGGTDPHAVVEYVQNFFRIEKSFSDEDDWMDGFSFGSGEHAVPLHMFLAWTEAVIKGIGYVNSQKARDEDLETTGDCAYYYTAIEAPKKKDRVQWDDSYKQVADQVMEWLEALANRSDLNEYQQNLVNVFELGYVTYRLRNYAASAVIAWRKEEERKQANAGFTDEFIGEVLNRDTFTLTLLGTHEVDTQYGLLTIVRFKSDGGHLVIWKTNPSSFKSLEMEIGDAKDVVGTIKKHDTYKGTKQTVINRCRLAKK